MVWFVYFFFWCLTGVLLYFAVGPDPECIVLVRLDGVGSVGGKEVFVFTEDVLSTGEQEIPFCDGVSSRGILRGSFLTNSPISSLDSERS